MISTTSPQIHLPGSHLGVVAMQWLSPYSDVKSNLVSIAEHIDICIEKVACVW